MDTYDMEVQCGMYCQGGSVKGVLEPYGYGSWVKVEDAESLAAENAALEAELAAEVAENVRLRTREVGDEVGNLLQEIADLKNELANVKAESLRVVKDGEVVDLSYLPVGLRFSVSGQTGVYRRIGSGASAIPEPHSFLIIEDCNSGEEVNVPYGTPVQPVRIERWEANDADHD